MGDGPDSRDGTVALGDGAWAGYDVRGPEDGPLLVLLPPLGGSGALFEPFRDDLARDHRVVTCEPPGAGASSGPSGLPSTRALAREVLRALDELGVPAAHLFGISLGGMVAQWIAIDAPERVRRLVLASTAARGPSPGETFTAQMFGLAGAIVGRDEPSVALVREVVADATLADDDERRRLEDAARAHPRSRAELAWLVAAAAAHDARRPLKGVHAPTLVITGRDDTLIPVELQGELAETIPRAVRRFVEGASHDVTLDRPEATAALVREFLAEDEGDGGRGSFRTRT